MIIMWNVGILYGIIIWILCGISLGYVDSLYWDFTGILYGYIIYD